MPAWRLATNLNFPVKSPPRTYFSRIKAWRINYFFPNTSEPFCLADLPSKAPKCQEDEAGRHRISSLLLRWKALWRRPVMFKDSRNIGTRDHRASQGLRKRGHQIWQGWVGLLVLLCRVRCSKICSKTYQTWTFVPWNGGQQLAIVWPLLLDQRHQVRLVHFPLSTFTISQSQANELPSHGHHTKLLLPREGKNCRSLLHLEIRDYTNLRFLF